MVVELRRHVAGVEHRVEDARRPRRSVVEQPPEGQVEAEQDGADGALLAETGEQRAGDQVEHRTGLDAGDDHTWDRHETLPPLCVATTRGRFTAPLRAG